MTIARDEIFGPVLCLLTYRTEEEAIAIATDTLYGLQAYVISSNPERARAVAARIQAGRVSINGILHEPQAAEPRAPMFFAVWKHAPIKTTLLRELEEVCDVTYREFESPEELRADLEHFFRRIRTATASAPVSLALGQNWA